MAKKETVNEINIDFVDPFETGVTYEKFIHALGEKSVKDYLSATHTEEQINWIESEINNFKNNK